MLASKRNGTLYGLTSNPGRRWFVHQHGLTSGFTARYGVRRLVWIEEHER